MKLKEFLATMGSLMESAPKQVLTGGERMVFVSDMHLGDRSSRDDFVRNEELVMGALGSYYLNRGWRLVLNGDIEELHKFRLETIRSSYAHLFDLFRSFASGPGLAKIVGNHDLGFFCAKRMNSRATMPCAWKDPTEPFWHSAATKLTNCS